MLRHVLLETAAYAAQTPPVEDGRSDISAFLLGGLVFLGLVLTMVTLFVVWRVLARAESERAQSHANPSGVQTKTGAVPPDNVVVLSTSGRRVETDADRQGDP